MNETILKQIDELTVQKQTLSDKINARSKALRCLEKSIEFVAEEEKHGLSVAIEKYNAEIEHYKADLKRVARNIKLLSQVE